MYFTSTSSRTLGLTRMFNLSAAIPWRSTINIVKLHLIKPPGFPGFALALSNLNNSWLLGPLTWETREEK